MGTHKIGKLKFNLSNGELAFRFGDGEIRRISLGKKNKVENEGNIGYDEEAYDAQGRSYDPGAYSGRFADSQDAFYDDEFEDEAGYAEEYDAYDDREYDEYDDRYDDGYDDGYDSRYDTGAYEEEGYYDEEGEYDDRYLDEDASDYGEAGYASDNAFMRFVDENDWVTYVLLFVLPPLGIYLLWTRRRFETPIRWAISTASAIWFVIVLILLLSGIFGGGKDDIGNVIYTPSPSPTAGGTPTPDPAQSLADATADPLAIAPTATPVAGGAPIGNISGVGSSGIVGTPTGNTVVMPATGLYYHKTGTCTQISEGVSLSNVTLEVAQTRGKSPCPTCYPNESQFFCRDDSTYYHTDRECPPMKNASPISKEAAEKAGKLPCPVCVLKTANSLKDGELRFATSADRDKSGITVYATRNGKYYHTETCSKVSNPSAGSLLDALLAGKTACPDCCKSSGAMVWATKGGSRYHNNSGCDGMKNAVQITVAEALVLGKDKCKLCWGTSSSNSPTVNSGNGLTPVGPTESVNGGDVYVYGTAGGSRYHTDPKCDGMKDAQKYTLKSMILAGRPACPKCCDGATMTVFASKGGTYYHSYATCSKMTQAQEGSLAQALAYGYKKCPDCWNGSEPAVPNPENSGIPNEGEIAGGNAVYCTIDGTWYHTNSTCMGMKGASRVSIDTAVRLGKKACDECAAAAQRVVYSTEKGTWYHADPTCQDMKGAKAKTIEAAMLLEQTACPTCIGGSNMVNGSGSNNGQFSAEVFKPGTSDIKVYATADGKYFHTTDSCVTDTFASKITLETALNYGKTGCPKCASTANTKVFALKGGKYYHYTKTCAGSGASEGTRAEALAYGFDPCPYCVTQTKEIESSDTYKAGTSGLKVYSAVSGKYYHADSECAGSGASFVTLETALNYGKKPCPSCASVAAKTVYSGIEDKYYHSSKICAGDNATSGNFAQALALGKKECPTCIGGSESYEVSDIEYSAPANTPVYIDLDAALLYYHNASRCSEADFSGGTKVTLEYAIDMRHKACPFCNPPTDVD